MFGQKKLIGLLISLIFLNTISFSQVYKAAVKSPSPVKNITWSDDGTMFAYIEGSSIYIRSSNNYELLSTISQNNIKFFCFSREDNHNSMLTLTSDGYFSMWDLSTVTTSKKNLEAEFIINFETVSDIKVISFSKTKDIIAASSGNNRLQMYDVDRVEKKADFRVLKEHQSNIYFTDFSSDSEFMISASEDGVINIWNSEEQSVVLSMKGAFTQNHTPVRITNDKRIIFSKNASTIVVSSFAGSLLGTIDVGEQIVDIKYLEKTNQLAVQTIKNDILFFSLATFKKVDCIPTVIESAISSFDINKANTKIFVAYEDGNVYMFNLDDVILEQDQTAPDFKTEYKDVNDTVIETENDIVNDTVNDTVVETENDNVIDTENDNVIDTVNINDSVIRIEGPMVKKSNVIFFPNSVYLDFGTGIITASDLFTADIFLGAEYKHAQLFPPFYFGGGYEFALGFPSSDFPYRYSFAGVQANSPLVYMNTIFASGGFVTAPWNIDLILNLSAKFGLRIITVAISAQGNYHVNTTKCTVYTDLGFGVIYKMFEFDFSCEYDVINGFCPKFTLGWNMSLDLFKKKSEQ
ncbi:MAG: hypothetical protein MR353_01370 [Spirochaetia bacterium]|nr:hypothetical protein [Spirochaetia bacterium]